jgi:transcriptional regulator with XRE-family HTH domain
VQRRMVHEVALAVRAMREQGGLTQFELAKRIGSSQPSVARIEKGIGYRTPQWETLAKIARALGKQLKLSFVDVEHAEPLVEIDGMPVSQAEGPGADA